MFITFEGIDFCGKSTQVELLKKYLSDKGKIVEIIREPGGTLISEMIRKILLDKVHENMCSESEVFLFSASRAQLVREKIRPYLIKGYYVISDRFHDSSTAYQGFGRGLSIDALMNIHNLAIGDTIPDITFFIDITVDEAEKRKRLKHNEELDRIEVADRAFFEKVRNGYLFLSQDKRFRRIDGMQSILEIHKQIVNEIELLEMR